MKGTETDESQTSLRTYPIAKTTFECKCTVREEGRGRERRENRRRRRRCSQLRHKRPRTPCDSKGYTHTHTLVHRRMPKFNLRHATEDNFLLRAVLAVVQRNWSQTDNGQCRMIHGHIVTVMRVRPGTGRDPTQNAHCARIVTEPT